MITRVEYEATDYRSTATVLRIAPKRWHVLVRLLKNGKPTYAKATYRSSLTSAQGVARRWVSK